MNIKEYFITAIIFVFLDSVYLTLIKNYFNQQIKFVQGSDIKINYFATIAVYLVLVFGLQYFIIDKRKSIKEAALLGLVIYAVYELTNLSLLKNWKLTTVVIDTLWGTTLYGLTTAIIYKIIKL
jgi:uncharacterized membrane protein